MTHDHQEAGRAHRVKYEVGRFVSGMRKLTAFWTVCFLAISLLWAAIALLWFKGWDHGNAGSLALVLICGFAVLVAVAYYLLETTITDRVVEDEGWFTFSGQRR